MTKTRKFWFTYALLLGCVLVPSLTILGLVHARAPVATKASVVLAPAPAPTAGTPFPYVIMAPQPLGGTADDTPGVMAAILAMPDGCALQFPGGGAVYNLNRISLYNRTAVKLFCIAPADFASTDRSGCTFKFNGVQGDVGFIDFNRSHRCSIEGIRLDVSGATYPQCIVNIDEWADPNPPLTTPPCPQTITTQITVKDCILVAPAKVNSCDGIHVSKTSATNCEFCRILHCNISSAGNVKAWGDGIVSWSYNQKGLQVRDCGISWTVNGIHCNLGTIHMFECFGTGNQVDVRVDATSGPFVMERCRFEQSGMAVLCGHLQDADFVIRNCEWGNLGQNATPGTQTYACQMWSRFSHLDGNVFASALPAGTPPMIMFQPETGNPFGTLRMENNRVGKILDNSNNAFATAFIMNNWFRSY